jgi:dihydrolipoamide dehydrogenase
MTIDIHPMGRTPADLGRHEFDVIVIGGGSTGENVAARAGAGRLSVVLVEDELVGGDCSYWACMPSKALLRSPEALSAARAVDGARQAVSGSLDVPAVLERRDSFTSRWRDDGQVRWVEGEGITLVRGRARITGERRVEVVGRDGSTAELTARHAVAVCTGSEAAVPGLEGVGDAGVWTSREATSAQGAPTSLVVVGGGVVGVELATAWAALGTTVTMVVRGRRLLKGFEAEAGRRLEKALRESGITIMMGTEVSGVRRNAHGVTAELSTGGAVTGQEILFATGRRPKTRGLGLEAVGLAGGEYLETDDAMSVQGVDGSWLYAAGDCTGRALLTHMGKYEARICGDVIAARANGDPEQHGDWSAHRATADLRAVPQVVFTDPQVAAVGMTETQAGDAGLDVRSVEFELGQIAGASLLADGAQGWAKIVVDRDREVLVGATFVGPQADGLLHAATIALVGEVPLSRLWHAVPSYPTTSEVWLRLLETWGL